MEQNTNKAVMKSLHQHQILEKLRSRFGMPGQAGFSPKSTASAASSAFPAALLKSGLHEYLEEGPGDWPSVLGFALAAASRVPESGKPVFLLRLNNSLQELGEFYGHGFQAFGLDAEQLITVRVKTEKELLWAAEEIAASQAARAAIVALGEREKLYGFSASRRLKLRTEGVTGPIFVLRHWSQAGATAAHSRWRITRLASTADIKASGPELLGTPRLSARIERCHGTTPAEWEIECYAPSGCSMASLLADRAARTGSASRRAA